MTSRQITHEKEKIHTTSADLIVPSSSEDWCGSSLILIFSGVSCDKTHEYFTTLKWWFSDRRTTRLRLSRAIDGSALFKRRDKYVNGVRNGLTCSNYLVQLSMSNISQVRSSQPLCIHKKKYNNSIRNISIAFSDFDGNGTKITMNYVE